MLQVAALFALLQTPLADACKTCGVRLVPVARIETAQRGVILANDVQLVAGEGWFAAAPTFDTQVAIYSRSGALVRTFGKKGNGPGEFPDPDWMFQIHPLGPRAVAVFHPQRLSVVSIDKGVESQQRIPSTVGIVAMADANTVMLLPGSPELQRKQELLFFNRMAGSTRRVALPTKKPATKGFDALGIIRSISPATDTSVWVARLDEYEIQELSRSGRVVRTIARRPRWFSERTTYDPGLGLTKKPQPRFTGLASRNGVLWTRTLVASADWKPQKSPPGELTHYRYQALTDGSYDTIVEAIDIGNNRVIATQRFRGLVNIVRGNEILLWARSSTPDGDQIISVYRPSITH